jgi:hypothetical protein
VLVHPASPVPAATAPPRSKNFRRSMDTRKTVPTLGEYRGGIYPAVGSCVRRS